jgi:hypothetical protein
MSSPFSNFKDFSEAKGPIYTYANNPTVIGALLLVGVGILLYFLYASYTMKQDKPQNFTTLSALILASLTSIATLANLTANKQTNTTRQSFQIELPAAKNWQPLAMLGMLGIGGVTSKRRARRSPRKLRRSGK